MLFVPPISAETGPEIRQATDRIMKVKFKRSLPVNGKYPIAAN